MRKAAMLVFLLLLPTLASAQTSAALSYACNKWPSYYPFGCTVEGWNSMPFWMMQEATQATTTPPPSTTPSPSPSACHFPAIEPTSGFLALGDSITKGTGSAIPWPSFAPVWGATSVNFGVSGDGSADMLARLPGALAASSAPLVVIHCCTNDVGRGIPAATAAANVAQMAALARSAGRRVVVVGPLPRDNVAVSAMLAQSAALEQAAASSCYRFLNFWEAFESSAEAGKIDPRKASDATHLNTYGSHVFMRRLACGLGWWCGD